MRRKRYQRLMTAGADQYHWRKDMSEVGFEAYSVRSAHRLTYMQLYVLPRSHPLSATEYHSVKIFERPNKRDPTGKDSSNQAPQRPYKQNTRPLGYLDHLQRNPRQFLHCSPVYLILLKRSYTLFSASSARLPSSPKPSTPDSTTCSASFRFDSRSPNVFDRYWDLIWRARETWGHTLIDREGVIGG